MPPRCAFDARALCVRAALIVAAITLLPLGTVIARDKTSVPAARSVVGVSPSAAGFTEIGALNPTVFDLALGAAGCAVRSGAVTNPSTLTVIDYSKPSTEERLWVFDLHSHELLYHELVAHGQGSGGNLPNLFSNEPETHRSSLGLFVTEDTYVGKNGYSLRLDGLDRGFNDRARERAIVMHGAPYVSDQFARAQGRLGRSWGCPALREAVAHEVIDRVKGGGLLFAYYPDQDWLSQSHYLGGCSPQ